jgi:outer membrane beta-barrel protein
MRTLIKFAALALVLTALPATPAHADRRNLLEGQPAVRRQPLMRNNRFELAAPVMGVTVGQDFFDTITLGLRAQYHILDWLSVGVDFGGSPDVFNVENSLTGSITGKLPTTLAGRSNDLAPTRDAALAAMSRIRWVLNAQVNFTPFSGKLALFRHAFAAYDFYIFAGAGIVDLYNKCGTGTGAGNPCQIADSLGAVPFDPGNAGVKVGPTVGAGAHFYITRYLGLFFEFRDTVLWNNPSGFSRNVTLVPTRNPDGTPRTISVGDNSANNTMWFMFGLSLMLPLEPRVAP